jgi:hypothetical protein
VVEEDRENLRGPRRFLDLGVFLAFGLLVVVMTWPIARLATHTVPSSDLIDSMLVAFIVGWQNHALLTGPLDMYEAPLFYPFDRSLLLSEQLLGGSVLALPAWAATNNAVLAVNVMVLATFPIAAFGMYLFIRDVTGSRFAGVVAGVAFAFTPYRLSRLWAPHVLVVMWVPYILLHLRRFILSRRLRNAGYMGAFVVLQVASSGHGALLLAAIVPLIALVVVIFRPDVIKQRRMWMGWGLALAILVIGILPFVLPYQNLYEEHPEFIRETSEVALYSGGLLGTFSAPPNNIVWDDLFDLVGNEAVPWEKWLFPGFVAPAFALVGGLIVLLRGPNSDTRLWGVLFIAIAAVAFVLSLGASTRYTTPFEVLAEYFPAFDRIRVPGRFSVITSLGLAGLGGLAVAYISKLRGASLGAKRWAWGAISFAALPLLLIEAWPEPFQPAPAPHVPVVYNWLETQPVSPVLELPAGVPDGRGEVYDETLKREARYLLFLTRHWHPILNGYGGNVPASYVRMTEAVQKFPDAKSVEFLRSLKVRYVIVHRDLLDETPWADVERQIRATKPQALVKDYQNEFVLDVTKL